HLPPTSTLFPYTTLFRSNKDDDCKSLHLRVRQPSCGRLPRIFPCRRAVDSSYPPRFLGHSHRSSCDNHLQVETDCSRRRVEGLRSEEHTSELQSPCNLVC